LVELTCLATNAPSIDSHAFDDIHREGWLTYPNGSDYSSWLGVGVGLKTYANDYWNRELVEIGNYSYLIDDRGRSDLNYVGAGSKLNTSYTNVVIPDTITYRNKVYSVNAVGVDNSVGGHDFSGKTDIVSVVMGNNIKQISTGTFYGCSNLNSVTIGSGIENIMGVAFSGCVKLNTISINSSIAPEADEEYEGYSSWGTGTDTVGYSSGTTNVLYVPQNATGYDSAGWTTYLLNPSYGKFTVSKTL
jgi:hypothetical protein